VISGTLASAFDSAGQRCSALRVLFVQDDVADRMIEMIAGAARELKIGDPRDVATHIGPVIDDAAVAKIRKLVAGAVDAGAVTARGGEQDLARTGRDS